MFFNEIYKSLIGPISLLDEFIKDFPSFFEHISWCLVNSINLTRHIFNLISICLHLFSAEVKQI